MRRTKILLSMLVMLAVSAGTVGAAPPGFREMAIGEAAPEFHLPGVDGKTYSLKDFADAKLLLLIFTCNHCPTAQAYEERIRQLHADYKDKGVALVAISPNDDQALRPEELGYTDVSDSFEEMKIRAEEAGFKFPYLYDGETQQTALAYGVLATPQVYLFDAERKLRYCGRIDNSDVGNVTSQDTRNAVEALLAGKAVPVERTRVFGCSTKWAEKRKQVAEGDKKWESHKVSLQPIDEAGLEQLVRNETDKLLLINVWATWCGPCVAEMPDLVHIDRSFRRRKFEMVTITLDQPEQQSAALKTLQENHLACRNYISTLSDQDRVADLIDKEWQGEFPHTVLIAPGGKVVYRSQGEFDVLPLRRAIVEVVGRTFVDEPNRGER